MKSVLAFALFVAVVSAATGYFSKLLFDATLKHMELVTTYQQPRDR